MAQEPKTPQQQMLETVKELMQQHRLETKDAIQRLGNRIDEMEAGSVVSAGPDEKARMAWLRETALRSAVELHRRSDGTVAGTEVVMATAKAFEAFLGGPDAPAA